MKKAFFLILIMILAFTFALPSLALTQSDNFYVTDETGLLSQDTIDHVLSVNYSLEENCGGAQVVVVFVDYFGDVYADEYSTALFNDWRLSPRAMLLVFSPTEGRGGINVGTEIEDAFTVDDINNYLDKYFWDDFDDGEYDKAVTKLVDKLADWFEDRYYTGSSSPAPVPGDSGSPVSKAGWLSGLGIIGVILGFVFKNIFVILIFVVLIVAVIMSDRRRYRGYYTSMGMPIPRYYPWYMFSARPYRHYRAPRPPRNPPPPPGGFGGPGPGGPSRPSRPSTPTRAPRPSSSGTFGGRSGRPGGFSRPGGGFRPSGGGRSGGSFGGRR